MQQFCICISSTCSDYYAEEGNKKACVGLPAMILVIDLLMNPDLGAEDNMRFIFTAALWSFTSEVCSVQVWIVD